MTGSRSRRAGPAAVYGTAPPIDGEEALDAAIAALARIDPEGVARLLEAGGRPPLRRRTPGFEGLAQIVVAQQVSTASAAAIFGRLVGALDPLTPAQIADASDATLTACGLSRAKIRTLRAAAAAALDGTLPLDALASRPPEEAAALLRSVPGIGPWTADVFLLFCLGHADAWPAGDLALQEAARLLLGLPDRPDARDLAAIGERWRPLRAVAARLMWSFYRAAREGREGMIRSD